jgi:predicted Na+-dependent transporter
MAFLIVATLIIGWLLGGPKNPTRKSMALSTVGRNSAVALVIASTNFPDSLAVVAIVVYGLVQTIVGLGVALALAKIP